MKTGKSLIDLTYLEMMSEGNKDLMIEMFSIFKEQVPEFIADMKKALADRDWKALALHAHKAKSSVAIVGIMSLLDDLRSLELFAKDGKNVDSYQGIVDKFISTCQEALIELDQIILRLKS
jgi:HPt (histidine-containing phosphotransfer) domain-containing protein